MSRRSISRRSLLAVTFVPLVLAGATFGCARSNLPSAPLVRPAPSLSSGGSATVANSYEAGQVIWWASSASQESEVEGAYGLDRVAHVDAAIVCNLPPGQDPAAVTQQLASDSRVAWAEPNYIAETAESRGHSFAFDDGDEDRSGYVDQMAAGRVGLASAHGASRGRGIVVAVLDTGVDPDHPLLASHLIPGYDFVDDDSDPSELPDGIDSDGDGLIDEALGHGSHVIGIVALVAPEAMILPLRVLDNDGRGNAYDIARAIDYARLRGARAINLSLGMLVEDRLVGEAIERARLEGIVVIASAGNWGSESPEEYPAEDEAAMAIAASGSDNRPTSFTSYGSHIALCAPGEAIRSTFWNGHTAVWSGTSMSAAWVTGGAALLLAVNPGWSPDRVLARLGRTAIPVDPSVPEATQQFGAGILDLAAALAPEFPGNPGTPEPGTRRPASGP
jgi:hypothetical protein